MNVVYILSDVHKALAFEWIAEELNREKYQLHFILLNPENTELEDWLRTKKIPVERIPCTSKLSWPGAWFRVKKLLRTWNADVVHCHLLTANILGLSAARKAGVKKRIYTRHHSSLHHVYHKKGVFWDRFANRRATHIVAISSMVKNILTDWEKVDASKIRLIPHGFRLEEFENVDPSRVEAIKKKYDLLLNEPVIGVISRFTEWKGVQYIIPAFSKLLSRHPQAVLMLLNAHGDYKVRILELLKEIPAKNYRLVPFEKDIPAVYKSFEVFVHTPVDDHSEAFGQTYVEALAAGIPSVFTLSGIAPDFIIDGQNALVVPHKDQAAIGQAIEKIIDDPALSAALRANGPASVRGSFELKKMISRLESLYDE